MECGRETAFAAEVAIPVPLPLTRTAFSEAGFAWLRLRTILSTTSFGKARKDFTSARSRWVLQEF
jgi:hypothetical protein